MEKNKATIRDLHILYRNSHMSKSRHFASSMRQKSLNNSLTFLIVIINILLGSVFFALLSMEIPNYTKWMSACLALFAAFGSGAINSFNFSKQFEGHRSIANRYLEFGRQCELLLSKYYDGLISLELLSEQLPSLHEKYHKINVDAEILPTSNADYKKAKKQEDHREKQLSYRFELVQNQINE
jgi:hypothetical protein